MNDLPETEQPVISCNFCGANQDEVEKMIAGADKDGNPAICNKCIEYAYNILKEEAEAVASICKDEHPEIADLLSKTREILSSKTEYSAALAAIIRSLHYAMTIENRLNGIEAQLQEIKERLKKLDSNISTTIRKKCEEKS